MANRLPLNGFKVIDLTAHRAGPTAVRQLADWGADVIKIEPPAGARDRRDRQPPQRPGLPEPAPQQAQPDAQPEVAGRPRDLLRAGEDGRRRGRELHVRRQAPARRRLRGGEEGQPAHRLRQHLRLRPGRSLRGPRRASTRSPRAWAGSCRSPVIPAAGPVRVGIAINDVAAGLLLANADRARAARARAHRRRPVGAHLAHRSADLHARLPGGALPDRGRGPGQEGNNHPTGAGTGMFQTADGYINIAASGDSLWKRFCKAAGAPSCSRIRISPPRRRARRTGKGVQRAPGGDHPQETQRVLGRT